LRRPLQSSPSLPQHRDRQRIASTALPPQVGRSRIIIPWATKLDQWAEAETMYITANTMNSFTSRVLGKRDMRRILREIKDRNLAWLWRQRRGIRRKTGSARDNGSFAQVLFIKEEALNVTFRRRNWTTCASWRQRKGSYGRSTR
jgi:hypothetical protein